MNIKPNRGSIRKLCSVAALLPVVSLISMPVLAQETESVFEEIQVTAKKREQSIYEVPVAISAFTGEQLENQGISDLVDVGKFVPNLNVTTFSAGHTSSVNAFIRGIGLQDHLIFTDPGVGVYLDGVYMGRQVGQNWSLSNIERVEVLRGPQGTLYGRNSIGGSINLITKTPGETEGARVGLRVGSLGRLDGDFFGDIKTSETTAVSISGAYKSRDGSGEYLLLKGPAAEVGELRDISGRLQFLWTPSDKLSFLVAADASNGRGGMNPYTTLIDELPNGALYQEGYRNSDISADPYDSNSGQDNQVIVSNEARGVSLTIDYDINDQLGLRLIASDRHSEYRAGLDDDSLFDDFLSFPEVGEADQQSYELQINGDYDKFTFVAGLYSFSEDGFNFQDPTTFQTFPGDFYTSQELDSRAIYANVGFQLTDRLTLSGGLRQTEDDKKAYGALNAVLAPPGIIGTGQRDWSQTSWELAATFDLSDNSNVYGAVQSGYQSGQFPARPYCLFGDVNCLVAGDNVTALNYEIGYKGLLTERLQLGVALFLTDYSDLPYQVSTTMGAGFDTRNIIVDQRSTGVEVEGSWAITDAFFLHGSLGYIDVDVDDASAVAPLTPKMTASLSPEFTFPVAEGEMTFRLDYSYRDSMWGEPTSDAGRHTAIDSRSLINADLAYRPPGDQWTIALYGRNLADERYDHGRLNTGDYVLRILSNDIREYGLRFVFEY